MIYLSISDRYLICAQWVVKDGKPLLTSISYKELPRSIHLTNSTESETISAINAGLHLIREDISFEGEKVFVTIPDRFTHSALVSLDQDMTENDGWAFGQWTIRQRWAFNEKYEYFGRYFKSKTGQVYVIRVPNMFTEPIKMAIQELGGEAHWMGTESSAFFGLNPNKGCTIFKVERSGYSYYQYSQSIFQNGKAKFIKQAWSIQAYNGNQNTKEIFTGQLIVAGKLSEKRKKHFKGRRIKQLVSMAGVSLEGNILPKELSEEDLYPLTAIITGTVKGVALNFFDQPGLQPFSFEVPTESKPAPKMEKKSKKKLKKRPVARKINSLPIVLYIFFFGAIGIMLYYDQNPRMFKAIIPKISFFEKKDVSVVLDPPEIEPVSEDLPLEVIPEYVNQSQSLIKSALRTLTLTDRYQILLLSMSDAHMDLELMGDKTMNAPIDSIGDVLNYSLRQVAGENRFKHGYLVKYHSIENINPDGKQSVEEFEIYVDEISQSFFKALNPIKKQDYLQVPVIVRISGDNYIQIVLNHLSTKGQNIALEKFVYKGGTDLIQPSAVFYLSFHSTNQADPEM